MLDHCFKLMYEALRGQRLKMLVKEELVKMFDMYRDSLLDHEGDWKQSRVVYKYLDDAREGAEDVTEEFDILTWWKVVGAYKYPVMSEIAKDVLAIPISSATSESAFSNGGRVLDDFRSSLLLEIVDALICSEDWLRNPDDNGNDEKDEEDQSQFMTGMSVRFWLSNILFIIQCQ
ncbi:Putative AC transposase [Linum perenne]